MSKFWLLIGGGVLLPSLAMAYETPGLYANFKRVGFDLGTSKVSNYQDYENSPNIELNQNTQGVLKGVFDFAFEYEQPQYRWDNAVYAEYGKSKIYGNPGRDKYVENADTLRLTSEYVYKLWHYSNQADMGPFANVSYNTEFTSDSNARRLKLSRGMQGIKLINGTSGITDFHLAAVEELDFTYPQSERKTAWQIGFTYKYQLAERYRFELESYYRDYLSYSRYEGTDFRYEFFAIAKLNYQFSEQFFVEPYVSYFRAEDREHNQAGSNVVFGVAVAFSDVIKMF